GASVMIDAFVVSAGMRGAGAETAGTADAASVAASVRGAVFSSGALSSTMVGAIGAIAEPGPEGAHSKPCAAGAGDAIEWVVITDIGAGGAAAASRAVSSS